MVVVSDGAPRLRQAEFVTGIFEDRDGRFSSCQQLPMGFPSGGTEPGRGARTPPCGGHLTRPRPLSFSEGGIDAVEFAGGG